MERSDRTPASIWASFNTNLPEPGLVTDLDHGLPGLAEPMPEGDAEHEEDMS